MKPSLDLHLEVVASNGARYRWDANQAPGSRPLNLSFRTKIGEGFSDATFNLARRIDLDYADLALLNEVAVIGDDGDIAYEGYIGAMPRELEDSHSIGVTLTGFMAVTRDRKFRELYVDRDLGAWGPPSRGRKTTLLTTAPNPFTPSDPSAAEDPVDGAAGTTTAFDGAWAGPYIPIAEAWYDAGPDVTISRIFYYWTRMPTVGTGAPWVWSVAASVDDKRATFNASSNLVAAGPAGGYHIPTVGPDYRYATLQFFYNGTPAGAAGARYGIDWYKLAVYGAHGLPLYTGEPGEPVGVVASDVVRNIVQRWCPMLDPSGVTDTSYVIQHLAFKDRTAPFDALLEVNKYHLWHLGVWERKRLDFRPYDLTDYDWQARTDDPGFRFSAQGLSTDDLVNGIDVTYTDLLTGLATTLAADDWPDLRDDNPDNPYNQWLRIRRGEITLSTPTMRPQALEIGRMALAANNRPKAPGTITVQGHIRDRAGVLQPAWKVHAGDTVAITNHPNDRPRLIHETGWDAESKTLTISVDAPANVLDAVLDRIASGFSAGGLG